VLILVLTDAGSAYIDRSNLVQCTDPIHRVKIGPIVGGAVGGLVAVIILWILYKSLFAWLNELAPVPPVCITSNVICQSNDWI
jgi:hypothetical protein